MKAVNIIFFGHVQGVGFRYRTEQVAASFPVAGFVRNLRDGTVELFAEGEPLEVDKFLDAVKSRMVANIEQINTVEVSPVGYPNFSVLPTVDRPYPEK